jgi:hypothetical protein
MGRPKKAKSKTQSVSSEPPSNTTSQASTSTTRSVGRPKKRHQVSNLLQYNKEQKLLKLRDSDNDANSSVSGSISILSTQTTSVVASSVDNTAGHFRAELSVDDRLPSFVVPLSVPAKAGRGRPKRGASSIRSSVSVASSVNNDDVEDTESAVPHAHEADSVSSKLSYPTVTSVRDHGSFVTRDGPGSSNISSDDSVVKRGRGRPKKRKVIGIPFSRSSSISHVSEVTQDAVILETESCSVTSRPCSIVPSDDHSTTSKFTGVSVTSSERRMTRRYKRVLKNEQLRLSKRKTKQAELEACKPPQMTIHRTVHTSSGKVSDALLLWQHNIKPCSVVLSRCDEHLDASDIVPSDFVTVEFNDTVTEQTTHSADASAHSDDVAEHLTSEPLPSTPDDIPQPHSDAIKFVTVTPEGEVVPKPERPAGFKRDPEMAKKLREFHMELPFTFYFQRFIQQFWPQMPFSEIYKKNQSFLMKFFMYFDKATFTDFNSIVLYKSDVHDVREVRPPRLLEPGTQYIYTDTLFDINPIVTDQVPCGTPPASDASSDTSEEEHPISVLFTQFRDLVVELKFQLTGNELIEHFNYFGKLFFEHFSEEEFTEYDSVVLYHSRFQELKSVVPPKETSHYIFIDIPFRKEPMFFKIPPCYDDSYKTSFVLYFETFFENLYGHMPVDWVQGNYQLFWQKFFEYFDEKKFDDHDRIVLYHSGVVDYKTVRPVNLLPPGYEYIYTDVIFNLPPIISDEIPCGKGRCLLISSDACQSEDKSINVLIPQLCALVQRLDIKMSSDEFEPSFKHFVDLFHKRFPVEFTDFHRVVLYHSKYESVEDVVPPKKGVAYIFVDVPFHKEPLQLNGAPCFDKLSQVGPSFRDDSSVPSRRSSRISQLHQTKPVSYKPVRGTSSSSTTTSSGNRRDESVYFYVRDAERKTISRETAASQVTPSETPAQRRLRNEEALRLRQARAVEDLPLYPFFPEHMPETFMKFRRPYEETEFLDYVFDHEQFYMDLGPFCVSCEYCGAIFFAGEADEQDHRGFFKICCQRGKVPTREFAPCPEPLRRLIAPQTRDNNFVKFARKYNTVLAMASLQYKDVPNNTWFKLVRIQGQVYARLPRCDPVDPNRLKYCQLWILDSAEASSYRRQLFSTTESPHIFRILDEMLRNVNPHVAGFNNMRILLEQQEQQAQQEGVHPERVTLVLARGKPHSDEAFQEAAPEASWRSSVSAVFIGENWPTNIGIMCSPMHSAEIKLQYNDPLVMPLCYPLLFPHGEFGWSPHMQHDPDNATGKRTKLTLRQHAASLITYRGVFHPLFLTRSLAQEFVVMQGIFAVANDLHYLKNQGKALLLAAGRAAVVGFIAKNRARGNRDRDHRLDEEAIAHLGKAVALPSSFHGSAAQRRRDILDQQAICMQIGNPTLFITFTFNWKWDEFNRVDEEYDSFSRYPLQSRVFRSKLKKFLELVDSHHVFGRVLHYFYVIEYTTLGNPHCHMILVLHPDDTITTPDDVDAIIQTSIPDESSRPELRRVIIEHNLHGPCGVGHSTPCVGENSTKCRFGFPRRECTETYYNEKTHRWVPRRICDEVVRKRGKQYDAKWVADYNPQCSVVLGCHVYVELVVGQFGFSYLMDYLNKGTYREKIEIATWRENEDAEDEDEPSHVYVYDEYRQFVEGKQLTACEAAWDIFGFPKQGSKHAVRLLHLHEPGQRKIYFGPTAQEVEKAAEKDGESDLEAFMSLCASNTADGEFARSLFYHEMPRFFVRNKSNQGPWRRRKKQFSRTIGRMPDIAATKSELFCLKLLLLAVKGPKSYLDLRTVGGVVYDSFQEAAVALRLVRGDREYHQCLEFASKYRRPRQLRYLFAIMLALNTINHPDELFEEYLEHFTSDLLRHMDAAAAKLRAKVLICRAFIRAGGDLASMQVFFDDIDKGDNTLYDESNLDFVPPVVNPQTTEQLRDQLNVKQREAYDLFVDALDAYAAGDRHSPKAYVIEGPAGTGKTFLYLAIIALLKERLAVHLVVAWTGMAASLLPGGMTCHSAFKLPLNIESNSTSNMDPSAHSFQWQRLMDTQCIIWDEFSMVSTAAFNVVNSLMQRAHNNNVLFGGVPILLGGDFRQVLPIPSDNADNRSLSLRNWVYYRSMTRLTLDENQRVNPQEVSYIQWLLRVGSGIDVKDTEGNSYARIEPECLVDSLDKMINRVYGDNILDNVADCLILAPKNDTVNNVNGVLLERLPGDVVSLFATNTDMVPDTVANIERVTPEIMMSHNPSGFPRHELKLKVGAPVMLLRNLDVARGLCNGTRMVVEDINPDCLVCRILKGKFAGEIVFVPRIEFKVDKGNCHEFTRLQFPISLGFAVTIHKAQGQTVDRVGVYLDSPCFAHGQLYVALSRVRSVNHLCIYIREGRYQTLCWKDPNDHSKGKVGNTRNYVYREIVDPVFD